MSGKINLSSPVTQTTAAVKQLIIFQNHGQELAEMPAFYRLSGDMVLVRNNKGDAYYVTTPKSCSCPAATYHPGQPCKHARKYFPQGGIRACSGLHQAGGEVAWPQWALDRG